MLRQPRLERRVRGEERQVGGDGDAEQEEAAPAVAEERRQQRHHDDREPDRLEHAAAEHRVLGEDHHVEQEPGEDDLQAAPQVAAEPRRRRHLRRVPVERHGEHEPDEEEEDGRGDGDGAVHQPVARPAHLPIDPPARGVVDHHDDQRHPAQHVEEREPRALHHRGGDYGTPVCRRQAIRDAVAAPWRARRARSPAAAAPPRCRSTPGSARSARRPARRRSCR